MTRSLNLEKYKEGEKLINYVPEKEEIRPLTKKAIPLREGDKMRGFVLLWIESQKDITP